MASIAFIGDSPLAAVASPKSLAVELKSGTRVAKRKMDFWGDTAVPVSLLKGAGNCVPQNLIPVGLWVLLGQECPCEICKAEAKQRLLYLKVTVFDAVTVVLDSEGHWGTPACSRTYASVHPVIYSFKPKAQLKPPTGAPRTHVTHVFRSPLRAGQNGGDRGAWFGSSTLALLPVDLALDHPFPHQPPLITPISQPPPTVVEAEHLDSITYFHRASGVRFS